MSRRPRKRRRIDASIHLPWQSFRMVKLMLHQGFLPGILGHILSLAHLFISVHICLNPFTYAHIRSSHQKCTLSFSYVSWVVQYVNHSIDKPRVLKDYCTLLFKVSAEPVRWMKVKYKLLIRQASDDVAVDAGRSAPATRRHFTTGSN